MARKVSTDLKARVLSSVFSSTNPEACTLVSLIFPLERYNLKHILSFLSPLWLFQEGATLFMPHYLTLIHSTGLPF